jgi:hypothetical protein
MEEPGLKPFISEIYKFGQHRYIPFGGQQLSFKHCPISIDELINICEFTEFPIFNNTF